MIQAVPGILKRAAVPEPNDALTLKSEVAELRYEVAELSSGELRLTFTTGYYRPLVYTLFVGTVIQCVAIKQSTN